MIILNQKLKTYFWMVVLLCQKSFFYMSKMFKTTEMIFNLNCIKIRCYMGNWWLCLSGNEGSNLHCSSCPEFSIPHITFSPVQTICRGLNSLLTLLPRIPQALVADPTFLLPVDPLSLLNLLAHLLPGPNI